MTNEEAKRYLIKHCNPDYPQGKLQWEIAINRAIDALERQKGKWVDCEDGYYLANCSECGFHMDVHENRGYFNFCPNCGADMRGGEDE